MAASSFMVPLGTPAPEFSLPTVDGSTVTLNDLAGRPALLVMFLCNHCPYVRHIEVELGKLLAGRPSLAAVGICSNDAASYRDDTPPKLHEQQARAGWNFPYLVDETQAVARAYRTACTPDFFLYDRERRLAYRGAFDDSTPGNNKPITGGPLSEAIELVLAGRPVPEPHQPSRGCSIKWRTDG